MRKGGCVGGKGCGGGDVESGMRESWMWCGKGGGGRVDWRECGKGGGVGELMERQGREGNVEVKKVVDEESWGDVKLRKVRGDDVQKWMRMRGILEKWEVGLGKC